MWWGADPHTLLIIYKSLIRFKLDYESIIYQDSNESALIKIDRIKYAAIRFALGTFKSTHFLSLEVESNIIPLKERRLFLSDKFFLKLISFMRNNITHREILIINSL